MSGRVRCCKVMFGFVLCCKVRSGGVLLCKVRKSYSRFVKVWLCEV